MQLPVGLLLLCFVIRWQFVSAGAGIDPLLNFCRRWYHQSQVKNNILFIDGGLQTFSDRSRPPTATDEPVYVGDITTGLNEYIVAVDLSISWDWKLNITEIAKELTHDPNTGNAVPFLQSGALFHGLDSDPKVYLYGGVTPSINRTFNLFQSPTSPQYNLWGYDYSIDTWTQYNIYPEAPQRPSWGASADAPNLGLAFYLDGKVTNWTSSDTAYGSAAMGDRVDSIDGLIVLNLTDHTAANRSTASIDNARPKVRGGMVYIPGVGADGILVTVGGASCNGATCPDSNLSLANMSTVDIFDVGSLNTTDSASSNNGWSTQVVSNNGSSGSIPAPRVDFCVAVVSAPDNSSHNLYMYGGWDPVRQVLFDEVWVLTIPSFQWTLSFNGTSPRFGHTCHVVGNNQMITVGGLDGINATDNCDWEFMSVAIWNLTENSGNGWGSVFKFDAAPYQVPKNLYKVIGGGPQGNASVLLPSGGWSSASVAKIFSGTTNLTAPANFTLPSNTTTPSSSKKKISVGAIAGAVVGGVAGLALIIAAATVFVFRRKRALQKKKQLEEEEGEQKRRDEAHAAAAAATEYHKPELENTETKSPTETDDKDPIQQLDSHQLAAEVESNERVELPGSPVMVEADSRELYNFSDDIMKRGLHEGRPQ